METSPQVARFLKMIRQKRPYFESAAQAAEDLKQELSETFGPGFDDGMRADIDNAASLAEESEQDVEILRRNSIVHDREKWYDGPGPNDPHWSALHAYMLNTKGWDPTTIESLNEASNEVVSLLDNPARDQFECRGLGSGNVTSPKFGSQ